MISDRLIKSHFDKIAPVYDAYKSKNAFYYEAIKKNLQEIIPNNKSVLDFGCGTGDILAYLQPAKGIGIDLSPKLIEIAQKKYQSCKNLRFTVSTTSVKESFDYIIMVDVVEHLSSVEKTFQKLRSYAKKDGFLIISFVNSSWEPILSILEKLKIKMPEGPHQRVSEKELIDVVERNGFQLQKIKKITLALPVIKISPITFLVFKKAS